MSDVANAREDAYLALQDVFDNPDDYELIYEVKMRPDPHPVGSCIECGKPDTEYCEHKDWILILEAPANITERKIGSGETAGASLYTSIQTLDELRIALDVGNRIWQCVFGVTA